MMYLSAWMGISQAAAGALVAAVWQGFLLAVVAWAGLKLVPKTPAAVRFAIWFAVFLVVAGLPVVSLLRPAVGGGGGRGAWLTLDARWCVAIAGVWALASVVRAGTLVVAGFRLRALWKRAEVVEILHPTHRDDAAMNGAQMSSEACEVRAVGPFDCTQGSMPTLATIQPSRRWGTRFGGGRTAVVCVSDEVDRPSVIGFFSPKILIPRWLIEKLTAEELRQIVLHETGHLGRADDWMNLAQKIALVVFPLNPALAWVERRLCFERELACDERVLAETGAPKAYAACLAGLAEYRLERRGGALRLALGFGGALGRESELGRRVRRILERGPSMRPVHARLVMGAAMLGLMFGAVELGRCPEIVGFRVQGSGASLQAGVQVNPIHGDKTAVNGARGFGVQAVVFHPVGEPLSQQPTHDDKAVVNGARGFGVQAVVFHPAGEPLSQQPTHDDKAVMNGAPRLVKVSAKRQPTLRGEAAKDGPPRVVAMRQAIVASTHVSESRPFGKLRAGYGAPRQWMMVTSWRSDGVRVVMTTERVPVSERGYTPRMVADYEAGGDDVNASPQQDVYQYAAVPVQGGWLLFQL